MAGQFTVSVPSGRDRMPLVAATTSECRCHFFAIGGHCDDDPTCWPDFAVLQYGNMPLACGHYFRHPDSRPKATGPSPADGHWGMWFDAGHVGMRLEEMPLKDLSIVFMRINAGKAGFVVIDRVDGIGLDTGGWGVGVSFPNSNVPAGTVMPYGPYTPRDTKVIKAELIDANNNTLYTDPNPYFNQQGFWAATFPGVAAVNNVRVRATGDANVGYSLAFNVV